MSDFGLRQSERYDGEYGKEVRYFSERRRNERKLGFKICLKKRKDGRIHQSEERENSGDENADECGKRVVPWEKKCESQGYYDDGQTHRRAYRQNGSGNLSHLLGVVFILGYFAYRNRVQSEVGYYRENREVIVNFRIESVSGEIEVVRQNLHEENRDERGRNLSSDLGDGIEVDFLGCHSVCPVGLFEVGEGFLASVGVLENDRPRSMSVDVPYVLLGRINDAPIAGRPVREDV